MKIILDKCKSYDIIIYAFGSIAQLGEHLPYKQRVTGSSPVVPTKKDYSMSSPFILSKITNPLCDFGLKYTVGYFLLTFWEVGGSRPHRTSGGQVPLVYGVFR